MTFPNINIFDVSENQTPECRWVGRNFCQVREMCKAMRWWRECALIFLSCLFSFSSQYLLQLFIRWQFFSVSLSFVRVLVRICFPRFLQLVNASRQTVISPLYLLSHKWIGMTNWRQQNWPCHASIPKFCAQSKPNDRGFSFTKNICVGLINDLVCVACCPGLVAYEFVIAERGSKNERFAPHWGLKLVMPKKEQANSSCGKWRSVLCDLIKSYNSFNWKADLLRNKYCNQMCSSRWIQG